jgi:hypothetical protein
MPKVNYIIYGKTDHRVKSVVGVDCEQPICDYRDLRYQGEGMQHDKEGNLMCPKIPGLVCHPSIKERCR